MLRGVRVFDGERFSDPTDLVFAEGVIADAAQRGEPADVIEGGFVIPGLIDAHIHLSGPQTQERLAAAGVTSALDMSSPPPLVAAMRGRQGVTDIRSGMLALSSPTSAHAARLRHVPGAEETYVSSAADAGAAVARRVSQGADYIKVVIDLPGFDLETVTAIVSAAHDAGLRVVAHASRSDAVAMGVAAGVDVLTHAPLDRALTADEAAEIAAAGIIVVPTLAMMQGIAVALGDAGVPGLSYEAARESVRALHDAGAVIVAGTDANETPAAPASPVFGTSLHDELALLVEAGLSAAGALRAATSEAADRFALTDRGRLLPGRRADAVLLNADPTRDISATREIAGVWIAGERIA